jgi:hypothetical protein
MAAHAEAEMLLSRGMWSWRQEHEQELNRPPHELDDP